MKQNQIQQSPTAITFRRTPFMSMHLSSHILTSVAMSPSHILKTVFMYFNTRWHNHQQISIKCNSTSKEPFRVHSFRPSSRFSYILTPGNTTIYRFQLIAIQQIQSSFKFISHAADSKSLKSWSKTVKGLEVHPEASPLSSSVRKSILLKYVRQSVRPEVHPSTRPF